MSKEISRKVTVIGLAAFPFAFPENSGKNDGGY
jgi:hypothetical protein